MLALSVRLYTYSSAVTSTKQRDSNTQSMSTTNNQISSKKRNADNRSLEQLRLVKGTFTPSEAKEVLMNLIGSKISFHKKKNLRSYEHHGREDRGSKQRIEELETVREQLLQMLEQAEENSASIKIESEINIELSEDSK